MHGSEGLQYWLWGSHLENQPVLGKEGRGELCWQAAATAPCSWLRGQALAIPGGTSPLQHVLGTNGHSMPASFGLPAPEPGRWPSMHFSEAIYDSCCPLQVSERLEPSQDPVQDK